MRISDWSSDLCSSDLLGSPVGAQARRVVHLADGAGFETGAADVGGDEVDAGNLKADRLGGQFRHAADVGMHPVRHVLRGAPGRDVGRSEEPTSELQSLMRTSYAVFCLKKKKEKTT